MNNGMKKMQHQKGNRIVYATIFIRYIATVRRDGEHADGAVATRRTLLAPSSGREVGPNIAISMSKLNDSSGWPGAPSGTTGAGTRGANRRATHQPQCDLLMFDQRRHAESSQISRKSDDS